MKLTKYNTRNLLRQIMKYAWKLWREGIGSFADALRTTWTRWKNHAAMVYILTGQKLPFMK